MIDRPDRTGILKNFQKPVLVLLGTEDTAVPLAQGLSISYMNTFTQVEILESTGHTGMLESNITVNSILNSFCNCVLDMKIR
jgi:pimeloyl-ACP methyl ester carboxylesterase